MLTNKTLNANVDPSAIGGIYTWSAESCTCVTACTGCSCVSFTNSTGTLIDTDFSTVVTYPDDCTSITIKLTIMTTVEGEQCVSTFYYNIINELGGPQLTWSCQSNEVGCVQIPSENQIFETQYDCLNCATCPCSTSNVCQDAQFTASYDCNTFELTIISPNQGDWCTVPYPVIETVNIVLNYTQGTYTHTETINLDCDTALPLVIDLTADPLPAGYYFLSVIIQLNGCQVSINNIEVDCSGGTPPTNADCCTYGSAADYQDFQQNSPPRVYTISLDTPIVGDVKVDFHSYVQADKLSIYSTWNNTLLTGTEIATTGYVGRCDNCCNPTYEPFRQGYFNRTYTSLYPAAPTDSSHITCNGGVGTGSMTGVPSDFSFADSSAGSSRLTLSAAYLNDIVPTGSFYIVIFSNDQATNDCYCQTRWKWKMICGEPCPCTEPIAPAVAITPEVCNISPGEITIVNYCQDINLTPVIMQWSLDGITWIDGEPLYAGLPALDAVTQTLYIRCAYESDNTCDSDIIEVDYIKSECCSESYDLTVECNPYTVGPYNQTLYQYHAIYEFPACDDTENPAIVEWLYWADPVTGNFAYEVSFLGSSVILDVYFNESSNYFFHISCNLCWINQYYVQRDSPDIIDAISNLLITHACEPCEITLAARYDYAATAYYISLDDVGGTNDLPATPVGQPPYILTITNNNVLVGTADGVYIWYNRSFGCLPPAKTFISHNISYEYIIDKYKPCTGSIENANWNYGFFIGVTNPGQYVINITDHDNCIAETTICNITAEIASVFIDPETEWTVSILPAFTITSYSWSLGDDLVLVSGTLTDSTITTTGGGNLSVQVTTEECDPITANVCIPTVNIISCEVEHAQVSTDYLPGANALNYYFKGLVANGMNISSANIQLVGSGVTAAAVIEANILSFLNTNLRPSVGGIFDVSYTSTLSTSSLDITWYNCEGVIEDMQLRLNESDNTTPANSVVNTNTLFISNTYILTLDYSPNVPITSYTWTLDGPTLGVGELTDSIIAVQGGGDVDIEIEVLDCGTATDTICIASITDFDTACATVDSVFSYSIISENDIFRGVEIGGTPYGGASIVIVDSLITSTATLITNIETWLNTNVVPTVGGYFTAVLANTLPDPFALSITWTGCDTLLDTLKLIMEDGLLLTPYYGSLGNTPTTIPDLFLIEALVEPAGTLSNEDWYATGAMVVEHVVSETQAYVLYGGAGTLTYSVDVDACGHATRTYTQV